MHADVLIAGGGPVGATLALALADAGIDVALIEPSDARGGGFRPIALSHGSRLILERVDAFAGFPVTPIETIHVSQRGGFGRTVIRREELDLPALGYVTDLAFVADRVLARAAPQRTKGRVARWEGSAEGVEVWVEENGRETAWSARLLVLADGGRGAGAGVALKDYHQAAIVARVANAKPHRRIAWERFTPAGPLALLPCEDRYALVWTVAAADMERMLTLDPEIFIERLGEAFGMRVGDFLSVSERQAYPLTLRFRTESVVAPRVVAIGNAAQTLHPVAGQGLNLGLRDAIELADLLRTLPVSEIGAPAFLSRVRERRRLDRMGAIGSTDLLIRLFSNDDPIFRLARGIGLVALDAFPPARRLFARRMIFGARALP